MADELVIHHPDCNYLLVQQHDKKESKKKISEKISFITCPPAMVAETVKRHLIAEAGI